MTTHSMFLPPALAGYIEAHSVREIAPQTRLREVTAALPEARYQIAPEEGALLACLVTLTGARRIVELGTFTGYSALTMALAMPADGKLVTIDVSEDFTRRAVAAWAESGVEDRIDLRLADGIAAMTDLAADPTWAGGTDLVFIDADKERYADYYEHAIQLLRPGGAIVLDNMLWRGKVADPADRKEKTELLRHLNRRIHEDPRVVPTILPVGDGVTLAAKRP